MKIPALITSLLLICGTLSGQTPSIEWQTNIGGDGWDECRSICETHDGGFILGGFSESDVSGNKTAPSFGQYDYWVVKLDPTGTEQWERSYGGSLRDQLYRIEPTADGGYIMGGWSESFTDGNKTAPNYGDRDCWVIKTDSIGEIEWQATVGGDTDDYIFTLHELSDGSFIFGGFSESGISGNKTDFNRGAMDYFIFKLDADGNLVWQKTLGGSGEDRLHAIIELPDGGFLCGGTSGSSDFDHTAINMGVEDYWVLRLDADGNVLWNKTYGGDDVDELFDIQQDNDGNFILAGFTTSDSTGEVMEHIIGMQDGWAVKLDGDGNIIWSNLIGGDMGDRLECAYAMQDGNYFMGSGSFSPASGDQIETSWDWDYWLKKLDQETGVIDWQVNMGGYGIDLPRTIIQTSDGSFAACGESTSEVGLDKTSPNYGNYDYWVIKLNCETPQTWYADIDGDGFGGVSDTIFTCTTYPHYALNSADCDDLLTTVHPGAIETCNGLDDNCNGTTDEGAETPYYADADGDGFGDMGTVVVDCPAPFGYIANSTDCNDADAAIYPYATESCNELDDNCDGYIDEFVQILFWADADNDGFGDADAPLFACTAPTGFVNDNADCDDTNAAVFPGATEVFNGIDDNCNDLIDEGTVAITEENSTSLLLYPNPAISLITIQTPVTGNYTCTISNALGGTVLMAYFTGMHYDLRIDALPAGCYLLNCVSPGKTFTAAFIRK